MEVDGRWVSFPNGWCLGSNTYFSLDKLVAQNFYRGSIIFKQIYPPRHQDDLLGWFCSSKFESSNQQTNSSVKSCQVSIRECYMFEVSKIKKKSNFIDILSLLLGGFNQPIWKICSSIFFIISPNRDKHKTIVELPPPSHWYPWCLWPFCCFAVDPSLFNPPDLIHKSQTWVYLHFPAGWSSKF